MRALTKLSSYLFLVLIGLSTACRDESTQKTISLNKIRPQSATNHYNSERKQSTDTLLNQSLINFYANDSCRLGIAIISIDTNHEIHFLDRFTSLVQHMQLKDSSQQNFQYKRWIFRDSSSCTEAFYNWLDQAGKNKSSVALQSGQIWSLDHEVYMIGKSEIILLSSAQRIIYKDWLKWYSGTPDFKGFSYIFYSKPKKKTIWMNYNNNNLSTL